MTTTTERSLDLHPAIDAVEQHRARLDQLQERWDDALLAAQLLLDDGTDTSSDADRETILQELTVGNWMEKRAKHPTNSLVVGIAGPGASGKGTVSGIMEQELGYQRVVNTTTRPARHYERDGVDYHFLNEADFETQLAHNAFLVSMERAGRGNYGVDKAELEAKLSMDGPGCIVEENPANLLKALDTAHELNPQSLSVILYILPPSPIVETSALRLFGRSSEDPQQRALTEADVESTLGDRQIDEFADLRAMREYPNVDLVVLVNDDLELTKQKIDCLFGKVSS